MIGRIRAERALVRPQRAAGRRCPRETRGTRETGGPQVICLDRVVEDSYHRARYLLRALRIEAHRGVPDNLAQRGPH